MDGAHPLSPQQRKRVQAQPSGPEFLLQDVRPKAFFFVSLFSRRAGSGELRTQNMWPKSIRMIMNGVSMARHGPIFGQNEPYVPPPGSFLNTSQALGPSWPQGGPYRSEGFPCTRLFHPWARWGGAWWRGKVPCRRRAPGPKPGLGPTTWQ